jgi:hypothetical protein
MPESKIHDYRCWTIGNKEDPNCRCTCNDILELERQKMLDVVQEFRTYCKIMGVDPDART